MTIVGREHASDEILAHADPARAAALLQARLAGHDDPEVRLQLGQLLLLSDTEEARTQLEAALRAFEAGGLCRRAALTASWLARLYAEALGNRVAARGWFARAWRLLDDQEPCTEEGWVALALVACSVADPDVLMAHADLALDRARRFGDVDLEAKALADGGLALVGLGRVADGMARLDEAMAILDGGGLHPIAASLICCSLFSACQRTGDLARAEGWSSVMRRRGLLGTEGMGLMLGGHCDAALGSLWCEGGRWDDAERALERSARSALERRLVRGLMIECIVPLADLRVRQGRLAEAERLLVGIDDDVTALIPLARLHLARGNHELANAVARRGLRQLGRDRVRSLHLLGVVVQAELAAGRPAEADEAARRMEELTEGAEVPALAAHACLARARVLAAAGAVGDAAAIVEQALTGVGGSDVPLVEAALHLELARLLAESQPAAAAAEAGVAAAIHARMGAPLPPGAAELLAGLGLRPPGLAPGGSPSGTAGPAAAGTGAAATLAPDGDWWSVSHGPTTVRLRDTKGMRYVADLVSRPGVERHVLDLVELVETPAGPGGPDRHRLGDAGPQVDARARTAYRRRLEELREELDDADALEDDERAFEVQAEIEQVVAELGRALGLGGRDRRAAAAAERARVNVTRAIRAAVARIEDALPAAGRELDRAVRTGLFCAYEPPGGAQVLWRHP